MSGINKRKAEILQSSLMIQNFERANPGRFVRRKPVQLGNCWCVGQQKWNGPNFDDGPYKEPPMTLMRFLELKNNTSQD